MALPQQRTDEPPPPYSNAADSLRLPLISSTEQQTSTVSQSPSPHSLPTLEPSPNLLHGSPNRFDSPSRLSAKLDRDSLTLPHINHPDTKAGAPTPRRLLPPLSGNMLAPASSPTEAASVMSLDEATAGIRREKSASLEDPDDRMAAEALCGLGKVEPPRAISGYDTPLKYYQGIEHTRPGATSDEPEPLLSLLTSSHPWLGGTINGSLSAYSSTKSYSPRFIQYGADFVERTLGSPVANTVGHVSRRTGVDSSLRRYLGARKPSELEQPGREGLPQDAAFKKRRLDVESLESMNFEVGQPPSTPPRRSSTRSSVDSLPPYDENRSPDYEETRAVPGPSSAASHQQQLTTMRPVHNRSWSTQLMISTSGLGAALNEASLKSLRNCLIVLKSANGHVRRLMDALKNILQQREQSPQGIEETGGDAQMLDADQQLQQQHSSTIASQIKRLNNEIWDTLKTVVNKVSRYTGGALPENASAVVRWQLMSVPRRWQRAVSQAEAAPLSSSSPSSSSVASTSHNHHNNNNNSNNPRPPHQHHHHYPSESTTATDDDEAVSSAHRMMAFAIEGIDMMDQVGGVIDSTIVSAEKWLDSIGRKRDRDHDQEGGAAATATNSRPTPPSASSFLEGQQQQQQLSSFSLTEKAHQQDANMTF